jgi:hypothetical protein
MNNIKQAVFFGAFNSNWDLHKIAGEKVVSNLMLKVKNVINNANLQITPMGVIQIPTPVLTTDDGSFAVKFSSNRIDIEEALNILDTPTSMNDFLSKVKSILTALNGQVPLFGRVALNGNIFFDDINEQQMLAYYKKLFNKTAQPSDWFIGETNVKEMKENVVNIKHSITKALFGKQNGTEIIEKDLIQLNYDINTTHKDLTPRFKKEDAILLLSEFCKIEDEIVKGIVIGK